jgi:predicted amidohydrolase
MELAFCAILFFIFEYRGLFFMKGTIYQTRPALHDLQASQEKVISKSREGHEQGAQLVVFPELSLTVYFVGERYHEEALRLDSNEIRRFAAATKGTAA